MNRTASEIGSEFSSNILTKGENSLDDLLPNQRFYLSGRTALAAIIDDINVLAPIKRAYLPSYCCESMIEPFLRKGIEVSFYSVGLSDQNKFEVEYDYNHGCDVVLVMYYFGFIQEQIQEILEHEKSAIIIQDITHSMFCEGGIAETPHYWFSSVRKWSAIPGVGIAGKRNPWNTEANDNKQSSAFSQLRVQATELKQQYLDGIIKDKDEYLRLFNQAETILDEEYEGYGCDPVSFNILAHLDIDALIQRRRENAHYIYEVLSNHSNLSLLFEYDIERDCPLFVPIILPNQRDQVKIDLIESNIYTPVHWPIPKSVQLQSRETVLYNQELSLLCDQRYSVGDMQTQCDVFIGILNELGTNR